ncbi:hypothetical protein L1987_39741 [Smallanthus sonchifolius]|uniref:Uncharacterized protein n=1 Tax=Smallanthus sonchifolius TaxID=185202 RepID=A0ACB9HP72_9ASTR|nr:hypothetical protein L1987_39741 [Smallanthus sonchifolius]
MCGDNLKNQRTQPLKKRRIPPDLFRAIEKAKNQTTRADFLHLQHHSEIIPAPKKRRIPSGSQLDEVRSVAKLIKRAPMKKNPLKNLNTMLMLNLFAKRMALLAGE